MGTSVADGVASETANPPLPASPPPAVAPSPAGPDAPVPSSPAAPAGEPQTPANRWEAARTFMRETADRMESGKPTFPEAPAEEAKPVVEPVTPPGPDESVPRETVVSKHFTVVGSDGKPVEIAWPKGAKVKFNSNGKTVEVENLETLVQQAQKGPKADILEGTLHRKELAFKAERESLLADHAAEKRDLTARNRRLFLTALFQDQVDEEQQAIVAQWREQFKDYADPRALENAELKTTLAEREKADEAAAERAHADRETAVGKEFHELTEKLARESLPNYPYLDESDIPELLDLYYTEYANHQDELEERYIEIAESKGISADDAIEAARLDAVKWLTEANLFSIFTRRNDALKAKLERRTGTPPTPASKPGGTTVNGTKAQKEADAHNSQVDSKLAQTRSLLGGRTAGASITLPPKTEQPLTYAEKMERIRGVFAEAAKK